MDECKPVVTGQMGAGLAWLAALQPPAAAGLLGFYALQLVGVQAILEIVQRFDATIAQVGMERG